MYSGAGATGHLAMQGYAGGSQFCSNLNVRLPCLSLIPSEQYTVPRPPTLSSFEHDSTDYSPPHPAPFVMRETRRPLYILSVCYFPFAFLIFGLKMI